MRVVAHTNQQGWHPPPRPRPRYELRHNDARRYRRATESHYAWVMVDHFTHRVVGYFKTKRLAERELARRT